MLGKNCVRRNVKNFVSKIFVDIRRWGLAIEHKYYNFSMDGSFVTYLLDAESPNYVLSIPLDVQRRNFEIEQPQRVESKTK